MPIEIRKTPLLLFNLKLIKQILQLVCNTEMVTKVKSYSLGVESNLASLFSMILARGKVTSPTLSPSLITFMTKLLSLVS